MKTIVIGIDGSRDSEAAVAEALRLAGDLGASVTFVCARVAPNIMLGEPFYQRELDAQAGHARAVVDDALARAAEAGVEADYEILDGPPAEAILSVAETHDADLLVVGSRGLGAVQGVLFGSVSKSLVTRSDRPVLVVKQPREAPVAA